LVAAAAYLATTEGGEIYLGVEKDGAVTGLHPLHQNLEQTKRTRHTAKNR